MKKYAHGKHFWNGIDIFSDTQSQHWWQLCQVIRYYQCIITVLYYSTVI